MKWIACSAENLPPDNTPVLLWVKERRLPNGIRYPAEPVWCDETWQNCGEPGDDFTHYMILETP